MIPDSPFLMLLQEGGRKINFMLYVSHHGKNEVKKLIQA